MSKKDASRGGSRSALMKQEDEEEARRKDVPVFSMEGLSVHRRTLLIYVGLAVAALVVLSLTAGAITSAANYDVRLSESFVQAKAGATATFDVTVQNTAQLSTFAYETHLVGVPPGWTVLQGEDIFGLTAGASRVVSVKVLPAGATPPNRDYTMELVVIAKTPDGMRQLESKARTVTVKLLPSDFEVTLLARGASDSFDGIGPTSNLTFTACGTPAPAHAFAFPSDGEPTTSSLSYRMTGPNLTASGNIELDLGADGTYELNHSLDLVGGRFDLPPQQMVEWAEGHPSPGPNATIPFQIRTCIAGSSLWNVTLSSAVLNYLAPLRAGGNYTPAFTDFQSPTGSTTVSLRVTNHEPRNLTAIVGLPTLPPGWTSSLPAAGTPLTLEANGGFRNTEFTLNVAKNASEAVHNITATACLSANEKDCTAAGLPIAVGKTEYFEVKLYGEQASIRTSYKSRPADILLFVQNLGNQPTALRPDVDLNVPDVATSFWYGDHVMASDELLYLNVSESRFLVVRAVVDADAPFSVAQVHPVFRSESTTQESRLFLNLNVQPFPAPETEGPIAVGDNVTVEYTVSTVGGALLFKTNQLSFSNLVDSGARPTHPNYTKGSTNSYSPYQYTVKNQTAYEGAIHEGFEAFLVGGYREESLVLWLLPSQTQLPTGSPIRDEVLVVEVRIMGLLPQ